jgi:hypothetical protein
MRTIDYDIWADVYTPKVSDSNTSVIDQLEILKRDYLGMRYMISMDKYHLSGIAEGLTTTETMSFVDWEDACDWATKVTKQSVVPYVILEMRGPNGEKENF